MLPARHFVKYDGNYASEYAVCSAPYCLTANAVFPACGEPQTAMIFSFVGIRQSLPLGWSIKYCACASRYFCAVARSPRYSSAKCMDAVFS